MLILVIFVTNQFMLVMQKAAVGQFSITDMLSLTALQIPLLLGFLLPLGFYLGVLLTLSRLSLDSELVVLAACGVSRLKITLMILMVAAGVALVVGWLMGSIVPKAQGEINDLVNKVKMNISIAQVIPGRFMVFSKGNSPLVIYARHVENHAILHSVFFAQETLEKDASNQKKWSIVVAKTALEKKIPSGAGDYVIFNNGYRYSGVPGQKNYRVLQFDQYGALLPAKPIHRNSLESYYSMSKLWSLRSESKDVAAELQWRLAMPVSVLVLAILAVPLGEIRPRYGKFTQLFPAILIYILYGNVIYFERGAIQSGALSQWCMWWMHGFVFLLAMFLMLRPTFRRLFKRAQ